MHDTINVLIKISHGLETGAYDCPSHENDERILMNKPSIHLIAEQWKMSMNESDTMRIRIESKDEELLQAG
jgi:hypothetical protein